jgi:hypothetical protein
MRAAVNYSTSVRLHAPSRARSYVDAPAPDRRDSKKKRERLDGLTGRTTPTFLFYATLTGLRPRDLRDRTRDALSSHAQPRGVTMKPWC